MLLGTFQVQYATPRRKCRGGLVDQRAKDQASFAGCFRDFQFTYVSFRGRLEATQCWKARRRANAPARESVP